MDTLNNNKNGRYGKINNNHDFHNIRELNFVFN